MSLEANHRWLRSSDIDRVMDATSSSGRLGSCRPVLCRDGKAGPLRRVRCPAHGAGPSRARHIGHDQQRHDRGGGEQNPYVNGSSQSFSVRPLRRICNFVALRFLFVKVPHAVMLCGRFRYGGDEQDNEGRGSGSLLDQRSMPILCRGAPSVCDPAAIDIRSRIATICQMFRRTGRSEPGGGHGRVRRVPSCRLAVCRTFGPQIGGVEHL